MSAAIDELDDRSEELEQFLDQWMSDENAPSVSVAVVEDNDLVYAKGHGARNLEQNTPATADTLYGIASCTKSFTAIAIMQLAEEGYLNVDDPVSQHVSFSLGEEDSPITIHDLLTHSSGVPGDGMAFLLIMRLLGVDTTSIPLSDYDDLHRFIDGFQSEVAAPPGERYFYYNSGYALLGEIIEQHTGMAYHEYIQEHILDPLGMERSTFRKPEFDQTTDTLTPYLKEGPDSLSQRPFPFHKLIHAAGGLLSSVTELSRYLRMNLNSGSFEDTEIVSPESLERMHEGYIEWDYSMSASDNQYGYGWTIKDFFGKELVSHIGDIVVSSAYQGFIKDEGIGVAVLTNTSPEYILQSVGEGVMAILLDRDWETDVPFFAVRKKLDRLTGRYRAYRGLLEATISREGAYLQFETHGNLQMQFPLFPETTAADDFRVYTISEEGLKKPIPVEVTADDGIDLYLGRWRLHKVA